MGSVEWQTVQVRRSHDNGGGDGTGDGGDADGDDEVGFEYLEGIRSTTPGDDMVLRAEGYARQEVSARSTPGFMTSVGLY